MSRFGQLWRANYRKLEAAFGEELGFRYLPMRRVDQNAKPTEDPNRDQFDFSGIFDAEPATSQFDGRGRAGNWSEPIVSAPPQLDIAMCVFPEKPRIGDRVVYQAMNETYEISEVRESELGRLVLRLNKA